MARAPSSAPGRSFLSKSGIMLALRLSLFSTIYRSIYSQLQDLLIHTFFYLRRDSFHSLIKEVNPFQQPEPTAFIVYTINPNRYHSKFEVGTYSRNRKVNYRSGPPSKLYLRSKRDINEMNELIIDGVHFPPWTHENCIIQRTR